MRKSRDEICGEIGPTHSAGRANDRNSQDLVQSISSNAAVDEANIATIVVVEKRTLFRECLTRCLTLACGQDVISFASVDGWLEVAKNIPAALMVFCTGSDPSEAHREVSLLLQSANQLATVLLSDVEDPDQIIDVLDRGARGYIPTSVSLEVAIEAMHLVRAGGVFVPAGSLKAARQLADSFVASKQTGTGMFTARQAAVLEALRRGKANKIIAYELNMRESTVKVHVSKIMKRLGARNRTEVAFMASGLMHSDHR